MGGLGLIRYLEGWLKSRINETMKAHKGINMPVRSRSWDSIQADYEGYRSGMARFVEWLKNSEFADGLFATTSLDTLIIGQSPEFDMVRSVIRINEIDGKFLVVFKEGYARRSESVREFEEDDLIGAVRKLISSLRWFVKEGD